MGYQPPPQNDPRYRPQPTLPHQQPPPPPPQATRPPWEQVPPPYQPPQPYSPYPPPMPPRRRNPMWMMLGCLGLVVVAVLFGVAVYVLQGQDDSDDSAITGVSPVNGMAATFTDDPQFGVVAVHQNGEQLISMTERDVNGNIRRISGAIWRSPTNETVVLYYGDNGLPTRGTANDNTFVFSNYTSNSVDIAIILPDGTVEISRNVPLDEALVRELQERSAALSDIVLTSNGDNEELWDYVRMTSIAIKAFSCAGTAMCTIGTSGLGAPACAALGVPCASLLISVAVNLVPDDSELIDRSSVLFGIAECFGDELACIPTILDTADFVAHSSENQMAAITTSINLGQSSLDYGTGTVQITLTWDSTADLDLWVRDPSGEEIGFRNPVSDSGGRLDVDDTNGEGPENIFWSEGAAPRGTYRVYVHYYGGSGPANYQVLVQVDGQAQNYRGTLSYDERVEITSFTR